jgi:hypothetical protein
MVRTTVTRYKVPEDIYNISEYEEYLGGTLVLTRATWYNISEDGIILSHCRQNLKSYIDLTYSSQC